MRKHHIFTRENDMLFSHVKRSPLLAKKYFSEMVWHFIGVYVVNRTLHGRLEIQNFSSCVEKYFILSLRSFVKYFSTLEEKFCISARPCNILYVTTVGTETL